MWKVVSKFTYIKEKELTYGIDSVSDSQIFFQIRIQIIKVNILIQNFFKWCFSLLSYRYMVFEPVKEKKVLQ
jgi:hypothetical protein